MPLKTNPYKLPAHLVLGKDNGERQATVSENSKYDNLFCHVGLNENDLAALDSLDVPLEHVAELILFASVSQFKFSLTKLPEEEAYRASICGLKGSTMPLHLITADGIDPIDAIIAVFYKAQVVGFPDTIRTKVKEARTRNRFS